MIYFIESESGHVKIGYTRNNVNGRLAALQGGNPHKLFLRKTIEGDIVQENLIHKKFSHLRCKGEWFKLERDLIDFIESPHKLIPSEKQERKTYNKNTPLKDYMDLADLSCKDVAKKTGMSQQSVWLHLTGRINMSGNAAFVYHKAFGISLEKLLGFEERKSKS